MASSRAGVAYGERRSTIQMDQLQTGRRKPATISIAGPRLPGRALQPLRMKTLVPPRGPHRGTRVACGVINARRAARRRHDADGVGHSMGQKVAINTTIARVLQPRDQPTHLSRATNL